MNVVSKFTFQDWETTSHQEMYLKFDIIFKNSAILACLNSQHSVSKVLDRQGVNLAVRTTNSTLHA